MKRNKFDYNSIHPDLRKGGKLISLVFPSFTLTKFRLMRPLCSVLKGRKRKDLHCEYIYIKRENEKPLRLCLYRPLKIKENAPLLLWLHGGGYAIGVPEQDIKLISAFANEGECFVLCPDYTSSLKRPYPAAFEECCTALNYIIENGYKYGIDNNKIILGGSSAGGGLCSALSLYCRDTAKKILFQMPLYPMLSADKTPSSQNNFSPCWNTKSNDLAWSLYLKNCQGNIPCYASPSKVTDCTNLAPTLTFIGDLDPFLDETLAYIDNLKRHNIPVKYEIYNGCFHSFETLFPKADISRKATAFLMENFKKAIKEGFIQSEDTK